MPSSSFKQLVLSSLVLLQKCQFTDGHFLWQETTLKHGLAKSLYTFAEKPGILNVEAERMVQMAYEKGVEARVTSDGGSVSLKVYEDGAFLRSDIPSNLEPNNYVIESFLLWGIFGEGGPPGLLQYFSSAWHAGDDLMQALKFSENDLFLFLNLDDKNQNDIQAYVYFFEAPVYNASVSFFDGDSGDELGESMTNEDGLATLSITSSIQRAFARTHHDVDDQGSLDGEEYTKIMNYATTFLEIAGGVVEEQTQQKTSSVETNTEATNSLSASAPESGQTNINVPFGAIVFVAFAAFVGSFLGTFLLGLMKNRHRHEPLSMEDMKNLDNAVI